MEILLLGEFSGLFNNLKSGFIQLGHQVVTISSTDGWKKIDSDCSWGSNKKGIVGKIDESLNIYRMKSLFTGYDVVYIVSTTIAPRLPFLNKNIISYIKGNNKKLFLCGAGMNDPYTALFFKNEYKYPEWYSAITAGSQDHWSLSNSGEKYCNWLFNIIDGYIPIMYEYAQGWRNSLHDKLRRTIPLAIDRSKVHYKENQIIDKLVVFHGLNRPDVKGTKYIYSAMSRFQEKYPNDVEVILEGNMPFNKYLNVMAKANVIIDQCYSCSIGMNGAFSLAQGKVLLGGASDEYLSEMNIKTSPIFNIEPSETQIFNTLCNVLERKNDITQLGFDGVNHVDKNHNPIVVAKAYIDEFNLN